MPSRLALACTTLFCVVVATAAPPAKPGNLAYNPTGNGFPKATASHSDIYGGVPKSAIDGRIIFKPNPVNRWTHWEERFDGPFTRVTQQVHEDMEGVDAPGL